MPLEGFLAYDDSFTGKRPGILVVHEWKGLNDYAKRRAKMLAQLGYVAFAADIYGKGHTPSKPLPMPVPCQANLKNDRALLRARVNAGLGVLKISTECGHVQIGRRSVIVSAGRRYWN